MQENEIIENQQPPEKEDPMVTVSKSESALFTETITETKSINRPLSARPGWSKHLWEFLMLFLAVFCGYLANYQLDAKIERDKAKELAKSFYEELRSDSVTAVEKLHNRFLLDEALKYLSTYFKDSSLTNVSKQFALNFDKGLGFRTPSVFEPRTVIVDQLQSSGSLRYFKNQDLQNTIGDLIVVIKNIYDRQEIESEYRNEYINPIYMSHYDYDYGTVLRSKGTTVFEAVKNYETNNEIIPFKLNGLEDFNRKANVNAVNFFFRNVLTTTRTVHMQKYIEVNARLLELLRNEYHLK